jgi:hypothetical protein
MNDMGCYTLDLLYVLWGNIPRRTSGNKAKIPPMSVGIKKPENRPVRTINVNLNT